MQQYNFSGWGWLKLGKGQQYLFKYEVIMDLLKFKSKRVLLYLLLSLNWRGGEGDCKAIWREGGLGGGVSANFVKVAFDLPKHISEVCFAAIILAVS